MTAILYRGSEPKKDFEKWKDLYKFKLPLVIRIKAFSYTTLSAIALSDLQGSYLLKNRNSVIEALTYCITKPAPRHTAKAWANCFFSHWSFCFSLSLPTISKLGYVYFIVIPHWLEMELYLYWVWTKLALNETCFSFRYVAFQRLTVQEVIGRPVSS